MDRERKLMMAAVLVLAVMALYMGMDFFSIHKNKKAPTTPSAMKKPWGADTRSMQEPKSAVNEETSVASSSSSENGPVTKVTLDAAAADLPDDAFVTGIVVDRENKPVASALVRFSYLNAELKAMGGVMSGLSMKQEYMFGEAGNSHQVTGRSKAITTGPDGRFRIRWPRNVPERVKPKMDFPKMRASSKGRTMSFGLKVNASISADVAESIVQGEASLTTEEWRVQVPCEAPLSLRAAHNDHLPVEKDVKPGDEVTLVLPASGGVRLKVQDATGKFLQGVSVRLEGSALDMKRLRVFGQTDEQGICQMLLPAGQVTLMLHNDTQAPQLVEVVIPSEGWVEKTVTLLEGLFATGRVLTLEGVPLEGATLNVNPDYSKGQVGLGISVSNSLMVKTGSSSHDGTFRLGPFGKELPKEHLFSVSHPRHKSLHRTLGERPDLGDFKLAPLPHLEVRVQSEQGAPVEGATVSGEWMYNEADLAATQNGEDGEKIQKVTRSFQSMLGVGAGDSETTNLEGVARVWGEGKYRIRVEHPDFAPQTTCPEIEISGNTPSLTVVLSHGFSVDFRVLDSRGSPLAGAKLLVHREEASGSAMEGMLSGIMATMLPGDDSSQVSTDASGHCKVERLAPGRHSILVIPPKGAKQKWQKSFEGATQMDLQFEAAGTFCGRVDPSLAGLQVLVGNSLGNVSAKIQPDGSWETQPLTPGRYTVLLQEESADAMQLGMTMVKLSMPSPDQKILGAGERKQVDLNAIPAGHIRVNVSDVAGRPHTGMLMALSATVKSGDMNVFDKVLMSSEGDRPGIFEFKRVPVGEWILQSSMQGGQKLRCRVEAGAKLDLVWQLRAADATLKGRVLTAGAVPSAGAVQLNIKDDEVPTGQAFLSKDGCFEMKDLVAGEYELRLANAMGQGRKLADVKLGSGAVKDLGDVVVPAGLTLRGKVRAVGGDLPMGLMVKLMKEGRVVASAMLELDGAFTLEGLEAAQGELQVGPMIGESLTKTPWNGTDTEVMLEVPGEKW